MNIINFLWPKLLTLALLIPLGLISTIIPFKRSYTTKITWDEYHGIPFNFLKLTGCYGPCSPEGISRRYFFQELDVSMLIGNVIIWYVVACFIVYGISVLLNNEKFRAIVTLKR